MYYIKNRDKIRKKQNDKNKNPEEVKKIQRDGKIILIKILMLKQHIIKEQE